MLVAALWGILPAYVANSSAVLWGGGTPIDLGSRFPDGRRVLGDGKTFRGFVGALLTGGAMALLILNPLSPALGLPRFTVAAAAGLSGGALLGDVGASFLKRRIGLNRGGMAPGLDQLDFLAGALVATYLADPAWFAAVYDPASIAFVAVVTPLVHVSVNLFAYKVGLKEEPW